MSSHSNQVNLYLVGFMGTGKSAIGRMVAKRMGMTMIDSDGAIEKSYGKPIRKIFEQEGEKRFRELERNFVDEGHPAKGVVVACGGGLVIPSGMLDLLKSKGVVICLLASAESILRRTEGNKNRPLLNVEDPLGAIETMLAEREPVYRKAGTLVLTDARSMNDIAVHVQRVYLRESKAFSK
ncbi:MAG: shikimate kinase [Opitutaceae bacterium]|nr:shikimate kinase [Opitutaceae bacterium]